ncbi:MAG: hypothetical protein ACREXT_07220, partial [Gammaproteobacteria bacterium]
MSHPPGHQYYRSIALTALAAALGNALAAEPSDFRIPTGNYAVTAQMIMPHLEEMRRITTTEKRCLGDRGPIGLFPVMDQPALRGCVFGYEHPERDAFHYV